ncbi:MAG: S-methyl-5-thioribose-1-phosphate isomerase [Planctomycetota bacterium]|nr:MAG: S-methyl-5-thioribose-1-phosphate isomerase [Planctomycetota bacterium]REJ88991.1 MAG: S-methyl-5-thioribose-1-phosphate isomerase [Planctomycetota bacterium]REK31239.1 MAG: S-methyl-5-thioribose-1-phosphate isomerase [Planctomycetota bacterium]REK43577.1 MAG: S-methyl-5-thioribose-1-phosphate isomerase [Planctomycetota bacterium]
MTSFETLRWNGEADGRLVLIDQTRLPTELVEIELDTVEGVWEAIRSLRVRGAPAIGIAAAYGVCLGLQTVAASDEAARLARLDEVADYLATSRPTAVNLFWALERMRERAAELRGEATGDDLAEALLAEARAIHEEDRQMCAEIGRLGAALLPDDCGVLTHCNAGALATGGNGTALAVFYAAHDSGKRLRVYCDETRPLLQGARLSAWELQQRGLNVTLICDSAAAQLMREGRVQAIVTGADRIAANGDVANKIGTYQVALAAAAHEIPFYVAAPSSTFDLSLASGEAIPIEQRDAAEITAGFGPATAPEGIDVYNPAFDVTPARLIRAIVCERGIIEPVTAERIREALG